MKKITMIISCLLIGSFIYAQQAPTGASGGGAFWRRGGNTTGGGTNNIFGTAAGFNSPIYTYTNGVARGIRNGGRTPNINGFNVNTSGFMGLGPNSTGAGHPNGLWEDIGPFSLLHLNGVTAPGDFVWPGGYRPWMRTGITFSDQIDLSYIGLRSVDVANNINEFVINWSNDPSSNQFGPDDMVFRFSRGGAAGATNVSSNYALDNDLDGLHVARFTGTGEFGLGPTFGVPQSHSGYVRPQSLAHLSRDAFKPTWLQITNQSGTGQTVNDGFRFGIISNTGAFIRQQELTPLIIQTDWDNTPGGIANGERMRISSIKAPGVPNPAGYPNNTTRVAISHSGNNPLTEPRSLLHLGYNTGNGAPLPIILDGWREWMDIGTFTNNGTDNIYVGLKDEGNDRFDAIINWGDNGSSTSQNGPDYLRFIFTETQTSVPPGTAPATSVNGLEVARLSPERASTIVGPNYGMMGIGDFTVVPPIDAKLDIDGDLRIRQVTQNDNLTQVLVIDPNDLNRVHWKDVTNLTGGFGTPCNSPTPLQLTASSEVQLNTFDFHFSGVGGTKAENNVGIGTNCFNPLPAKLSVNQQTTDFGTTAAYILNRDDSYPPGTSSVALFAKTTGDADPASCKSVAGWFETEVTSAGSLNMAICVPDAGGRVSIGFAPKDPNTPNDEPDVCAVEQSQSLVEVNGTIFAGGMTLPSDINFKKNIVPISGALNMVKKLNGVYYDYDNTNYPALNFSNERQVGMIAQNVDTVLTEVTTYDSTLQAYTMDYARINALLVEAIKEQDTKMDSMMTKINELENCLNQSNICNNSQRTSNQGGDDNQGQTLTLQNANAIVLDQNLPNPFAENTTITYMIPEDVIEATLLFYDMNGRIINQIEITDRGESRLTVYGDNLEQGIYTYSLIADGKLIATKKMVKQ